MTIRGRVTVRVYVGRREESTGFRRGHRSERPAAGLSGTLREGSLRHGGPVPPGSLPPLRGKVRMGGISPAPFCRGWPRQLVVRVRRTRGRRSGGFLVRPSNERRCEAVVRLGLIRPDQTTKCRALVEAGQYEEFAATRRLDTPRLLLRKEAIMAAYSANRPNRTLNVHKESCGRVRRAKLRDCGCGSTGAKDRHQWWCEKHINLEAVTKFMRGRFWAVLVCDECFSGDQ